MNQTIRNVMLVGLALNLTACGFNPSKKADNASLQKLNELREQYIANPSMTYGIASGRTPEEAVQNARIDLSKQILTLVQKKTSSQVTVDATQKGARVSKSLRQRQTTQSASFSTVELENTQIIKQTADENGRYYAVVGADKATIEKIKQKARQTASTLVIIEQLQQASGYGQQINLIEKGLKEVARHGIADDTVLIDGDRYTFGAFFDKKLNEIIKSIRVAVTKDNEVYDVYLLEKASLDPVPGVKVSVNQQKGFTDRYGKFIVAELPRSTQIALLVNDKPYLMSTFIKGTSHSNVYINTQPKGFLAELKQDYKVVASITTPEMVPLDHVSASERYEIKLHGNEQYPSLSQRIKIYPGFDYVYFKQFEKLTFGKVDLGLEEEDNELSIVSAKGEQIYQGQKGYQNNQLPVGSYEVTVQREDHDPEYQIVEDSFLLHRDQRIKRTYFEPKYRQYYRKGSVFSLGFIAGGSPNENAEYTASRSFSGTRTGKDLSYNPSSFGFGLNYKYYLTNLYFGGGLGMVSVSDSSSSSSSSDTLNGFPIEAMMGLYTSFDGDKYIGVEGGYRKLSLSPSSDSYALDIETDISSPFIGALLKIGGFELGVKYYTAGNSTIGFFIGMGGDGIEEGYRLPERVKAVKGRDYE